MLGVVATQLTTPDTTRTYTVTVYGPGVSKDISGDVFHDSLVMEDQGTAVQGTTSFLVTASQANTAALTDQALVTIEDHLTGTYAFRGFVDSRKPSRTPAWDQIEVVCSDDTSLMDVVIPYELRPAGESDAARIGYLWGLYTSEFLQGTMASVSTVQASMPAQQFAGVTLRQALDMIAAQASTSAYWYVDNSGKLHYGTTETNPAPKNVTSDTPGGTEIAPMDLTIDFDSKGYVWGVYVRGKTDDGSGWVYNHAARVAAGGVRRTRFLDAPDSTTSTMRDAIGNAFLAKLGYALTRGSFSCVSSDSDGWRAGQYVTVRSTHLGNLNTSYRIARVRTSVLGPRSGRPAGLRQYEVEFGAASTPSSGDTGPVVGTGIVGDLLDEYGNTILGAGTSGVVAGLGGAIRRFITSGVYNGDFVLTPPYPDSTIVNSYNPLPYWSFASASGTSITATSVADSASGSGRIIRFQMDAGGGAGDDAYLEQIIPINSARGQNYYHFAGVTFITGATVSAAKVYVSAIYLQDDASTTTGVIGTNENTTTSIGAATLTEFRATPNSFYAPSDAAYLRVRVGFKRDAAATSVAESVTLAEVVLYQFPARVAVVDTTAPSTYSQTILTQTAGVATLQANYSRPSGSTPQVVLGGAAATPYVQITGSAATLLRYGGTSFPASPTTNDLFYRTDLGYWCYYDGTRWLSCHIETTTLGLQEALIGAAANATFWAPYMGNYNIYAIEANVATDVFTTNNATNYWTVQVGTQDGGVATPRGSSFNTSADAVATMTTHNVPLGVVLGTSTDAWYVSFTKTLTPGTIYVLAQVRYRIILT